PARADYLNMGYAIKAALPDDDRDAFELWWSWCARWSDGENDRETAEADWSRMRPPYAIGAPWLFDKARAGGWDDAVTEFAADPIPLETPDSVVRPDNSSGAVPYSDAWLARRFRDVYGDRVRYCGPLGG